MLVARLVVRSRQVGVAGVARTVWVCFVPGASRSPGVQASSGFNRRRQSQRPAIVCQLATPTRCRIVFSPLHGHQTFPSLSGSREKSTRTRERSDTLGRGHRAGGVTPVEVRTGPAVKTSNPRLSPRGARSAVGGIRARAENPAAGPAVHRLYSYRGRLHEPDPNNLLGLVHGRGIS